jgi:hypothetical protein
VPLRPGDQPSPSPNPSGSLPPDGRNLVPLSFSRHVIDNSSGRIKDVVVVSGRIVAVGSADGEPAAWWSSDGIAWQRAAIASDPDVGDVWWLGPIIERPGGELVALAILKPVAGAPRAYVSHDAGASWQRDDRIRWTDDADWDALGVLTIDVAPGGPGFVAAGTVWPEAWALYLPMAAAWTSKDGLEWSHVTLPPSDSPVMSADPVRAGGFGTVTVADGAVYMLGSEPGGESTGRPVAWRSENGLAWEQVNVPASDTDGTVDAIVTSGDDLFLAATLGTEPETLHGQVWSRVGRGWEEELTLPAPSWISSLQVISDGRVVAIGRQDGLPAVWFGAGNRSWSWTRVLVDDRMARIEGAVEFNGRMVVLGSLVQETDDGEQPTEVVAWTTTTRLGDGLPIDCLLGGEADCDTALNAATDLLVSDGDRPAGVVIGWGRGLIFHAEVHACYPSGIYRVIDVLGEDPPKASLRDGELAVNPCQ